MAPKTVKKSVKATKATKTLSSCSSSDSAGSKEGLSKIESGFDIMSVLEGHSCLAQILEFAYNEELCPISESNRQLRDAARREQKARDEACQKLLAERLELLHFDRGREYDRHNEFMANAAIRRLVDPRRANPARWEAMPTHVRCGAIRHFYDRQPSN